jgi:membrane-associated phospholipid phosphatase
VFLRRFILLAAAFAALAALVAVGTFSGLDQWSVDHLMPGAHVREPGSRFLEGLVPLLHARWSGGLAIAANIITLPASFLFSLALVAWRSRPLALALLGAVAVEVVCKELLVRPALHDGALHIRAFDSSFPSGHALRVVLVAAALPRCTRVWAAAWAVAAIALLELAGWHTPTDIAGGIVLAGLALLGVGALRGRRLRA